MSTTPHHKIKVKEGDFMLPREAAAVLIGIAPETLGVWLKQPNPPPYDEVRKGFPARELGHWMRKKQTVRRGIGQSLPYLPDGVVISHDPPKSGGLPSASAPAPSKKDYNVERTRKEAAAADKIEMENAVARGELVPAADVEKGWTDILSRVKTRMMQVPYTCAMVVVGDMDMASVQSKIREAVRDALMEMSGDWRDTATDDEND